MPDIPLRDRRIRMDLQATGARPVNPIGQDNQNQGLQKSVQNAGLSVLGVAEVFKKIKRQNDIARATNDLSVYRNKVNDLLTSTEVDPETGEVIGFINKKGENAFNNIETYQQKLSNLTKEYQEQIHSYMPDIRDKFTMDSDEIHIDTMTKINQYALKETEEFQRNSANAFFDNVKRNEFLRNPNDYKKTYASVYEQNMLINPGQSEDFYKNETQKIMSETISNSIRKMNEQDSNLGAYAAYSRGSQFIRNLVKSGSITKDMGQDLLKNQQNLRFSAVQLEGTTTIDVFKNLLINADGLDKYEKIKYLYDYAKSQDKKNGTGTSANLNEWKKRLIEDPQMTQQILGVELSGEQLDALPNQILSLLRFVKTKVDKNGKEIAYLDEEGLKKDPSFSISLSDKNWTNALNLLKSSINGYYDINGKRYKFANPLISLTPEDKQSFASYLNSKINANTPYKQRLLNEYTQRKDEISKFLSNIKLGDRSDMRSEYGYGLRGTDGITSQDVIGRLIDFSNFITQNNLTEHSKEVAEITSLAMSTARKLSGYEIGKTNIVDYFQKRLSDIRSFFVGPIMFNDPTGVREINQNGANTFRTAWVTNGRDSILGKATVAGINNITLYNMYETLMDADADNPLRIAYNINDNRNIKTAVATVNNVAIPVEDADYANAEAIKNFISQRTAETGINYSKYLQTIDANDLSKDDKILLETLLIKSLAKRVPGFVDMDMGGAVSVAESLSGIDSRKNQEITGRAVFLTNNYFLGNSYAFENDNLEKISNISSGIEPVVDMTSSEYVNSAPIYEYPLQNISSSRIIDTHYEELKDSFSPGLGVYNGLKYYNKMPVVEIRVLNEKNKDITLYVKPPNKISSWHYAKMLSNYINKPIYLGSDKYGKTILKSVPYANKQAYYVENIIQQSDDVFVVKKKY